MAAIKGAADDFAANALPLMRQLQTTGVMTVRAIAEALDARSIRTARGGICWGVLRSAR